MSGLTDLLTSASRTVVFTGAGVSTLCGVPDFRSPGGIYAQLDTDRIFDAGEFRRHPRRFYEQTRDFLYGMGEVEPGPVHTVCAELERRGLVQAVVTQNIDMLHRRAGSRRVIELHGSLDRHVCPACAWTTGFEPVAAEVRQGRLPLCPECGGPVKPGLTFFGELLPDGALEEAFDLAAACDLVVVLGSSLLVQPAASVPLQAVRSGARLGIVNREPTPLDRYAEWRGTDLAAEFAALAAWLAATEGS